MRDGFRSVRKQERAASLSLGVGVCVCVCVCVQCTAMYLELDRFVYIMPRLFVQSDTPSSPIHAVRMHQAQAMVQVHDGCPLASTFKCK